MGWVEDWVGTSEIKTICNKILTRVIGIENQIKRGEEIIMAKIDELMAGVDELKAKVDATGNAVQAEIVRVEKVIADLQALNDPALDHMIEELQNAKAGLDVSITNLNAERPEPPTP